MNARDLENVLERNEIINRIDDMVEYIDNLSGCSNFKELCSQQNMDMLAEVRKKLAEISTNLNYQNLMLKKLLMGRY